MRGDVSFAMVPRPLERKLCREGKSEKQASGLRPASGAARQDGALAFGAARRIAARIADVVRILVHGYSPSMLALAG